MRMLLARTGCILPRKQGTGKMLFLDRYEAETFIDRLWRQIF